MAKFKCVKRSLAFSLKPEGDFHLHVGETYELPENNTHIKALAGKGFLERVKDQKTRATEESSKKVKPSKNKHK